MKIAFILKHKIRGLRTLIDKLQLLRASGSFALVEIWNTEYAGHAIKLADAACGQVDYLIAVGGDGTLNEVVNGCMEARRLSPQVKSPVIGLLSYGTANDFIKSTTLKGGLDEITRLIEARSFRRIDVGKVAYRDKAGNEKTRHFVNIADVGIGAEVARKVNERRKWLGATFTFLKAILETLLTYRKRELALSADNGFNWQGQSLIVAVANGRFFSSGLCFVPQADIENGKLNVTLVGKASVLDFLLHLPEFRRGDIIEHRYIQYFETERLRIDSQDKPAPLEADGEFLGYTPAEFEILPGGISFLAPSS